MYSFVLHLLATFSCYYGSYYGNYQDTIATKTISMWKDHVLLPELDRDRLSGETGENFHVGVLLQWRRVK